MKGRQNTILILGRLNAANLKAEQETEPHELLYFKVYKSQLPVIEQALETAALMLSSDKSRGYRLEMVCAGFLAGANMEGANPETFVLSLRRVFELLHPISKVSYIFGNSDDLDGTASAVDNWCGGDADLRRHQWTAAVVARRFTGQLCRNHHRGFVVLPFRLSASKAKPARLFNGSMTLAAEGLGPRPFHRRNVVASFF